MSKCLRFNFRMLLHESYCVHIFSCNFCGLYSGTGCVQETTAVFRSEHLVGRLFWTLFGESWFLRFFGDFLFWHFFGARFGESFAKSCVHRGLDANQHFFTWNTAAAKGRHCLSFDNQNMAALFGNAVFSNVSYKQKSCPPKMCFDPLTLKRGYGSVALFRSHCTLHLFWVLSVVII